MDRHPLEIESVSESFKQEVIVETNKILGLLKNDISLDEPADKDELIKHESVEKQYEPNVVQNETNSAQNEASFAQFETNTSQNEASFARFEASSAQYEASSVVNNEPIIADKKAEETHTVVRVVEKEIVKQNVEEVHIENKVPEDIKINKPNILQLETNCIKQIEEFAMSKTSSDKSREDAIKVTPDGEVRTNNAIVITPDDVESESLLAKHTSDSGKLTFVL